MKKVGFVFCLFILLFLVSCQNDVSQKIQIRTTIESVKDGDATVSVFLEGPLGNTVDGALVLVSDSSNSVSQIRFDPTRHCYCSTLPVPFNREFQFTIQSVLLDSQLQYSIIHEVIPHAPIIAEFRDSKGNSVLSGQKLSRESSIQVNWDSVIENAVYCLAISTPFADIYTGSTRETSMTIPPLPDTGTSSLYLSITAQSIRGDPFFVTHPYYSVSIYPSASTGFSFE